MRDLALGTRYHKKSREEESVNMAPMLSLMMCLIPVVLISASFVHLKQLSLGYSDSDAQEQNVSSTTSSVDTLYVYPTKGRLHFSINNKKARYSLSVDKVITDKKVFLNALTSLKDNYPSLGHIRFSNMRGYQYGFLLKLMDAAKYQAKTEEGKALFQSVSLAGVFE